MRTAARRGKSATGVPITDLAVSGFTGTVALLAETVYILSRTRDCANWTWSDVSVTIRKKSSCENVSSGVSCQKNGQYEFAARLRNVGSGCQGLVSPYCD